MSTTDFEFLLNKISPLISKQDTQLRKAVPTRKRLAITLRYFATGDSFQSLHFLFKVSPQLISTIAPEVCKALNHVLRKEIQIPSSAEEWLEIEKGFSSKFPRAIGAIDGKHIVLTWPQNSGSEYFNYKKSFSIVLMALVDSKYNFIFADIGGQGKISDGGIFRHTLLWEMISSNTLNLPASHPLPGSNVDIPYVFLSDGAFALHPNIMKPYPGNHDRDSPERMFNKKLSGSRVVVDNTFGILSSKFRIFKRPIELCSEKASVITMTCILLHNYLIKSNTSSQMYSPQGTVDVYDDNDTLIQPGTWRIDNSSTNATQNIPPIARRAAANARQVRDEFKNYFSNVN
ncbi:unnamed protein product [Acanthoscelides obtectus]|uniref:DDE Tnp4 domain-containing protein n=1 Tax=Acanthoscelides obtectus TaxID=200917 RepID=A0A9P0K8H0_ACAOB|nr:unnamed protein product [Acanthoscelides obtectus]CAK1648486.1 Protein ALP1-like [Acanthoscelides obtectus]